MSRHINQRRGFTVIEILVVLAIMGLLLAMLFSRVSIQQKRAEDSARLADMQLIELSLAQYALACNGLYPDSIYTDNDSPSFNSDTNGYCADGWNSFLPTGLNLEEDGLAPTTYIYRPLYKNGTHSQRCTGYHLAIPVDVDSALLDNDHDVVTPDNGNGWKICRNTMGPGSSTINSGIDGANDAVDGLYDHISSQLDITGL